MYEIDEFRWKRHAWENAWRKTFELLYDGPVTSEDYVTYINLVDKQFDNWEEMVLDLDDIDDLNHKHHVN